MRWINSIGREIFGLFVDDGRFALAIMVWLALSVLILPRIAAEVAWTGPMLFTGFALILIQSALRTARRGPK